MLKVALFNITKAKLFGQFLGSLLNKSNNSFKKKIVQSVTVIADWPLGQY